MSQNRKLQTEIERVFKKISEGVENFEDIWSKLYSTDNLNQKEKFEADLKKEIKKLQRHRDQIKTWVSSGEIKDKKPLLEQRKLIETQMERFKACEKEMKTKAYSKEGLASNKMDPREKAKMETRKWITDLLDILSTQIDSYEAELELLQAKKKTTSIGERMEKVENVLERHKFHQGRLELILRLVENDSLEIDKINPLKDDITYYTESHEDPDFVEDPGLYDELELRDDMFEDDYSDDSDEDDDGGQSSRPTKEPKKENKATEAAPAPVSMPATAPVAPAPLPTPTPASVPAASSTNSATAPLSSAKSGKRDDLLTMPSSNSSAAVSTPAPVPTTETVTKPKGGKDESTAKKSATPVSTSSAITTPGLATAAGTSTAGTTTAVPTAAAVAVKKGFANAAAGASPSPAIASVTSGATNSNTPTATPPTTAAIAAKADVNSKTTAAPTAVTSTVAGTNKPSTATIAAGAVPSLAAVAAGAVSATSQRSASSTAATAGSSQGLSTASIVAGRTASTPSAMAAPLQQQQPATAVSLPQHVPQGLTITSAAPPMSVSTLLTSSQTTPSQTMPTTQGALVPPALSTANPIISQATPAMVNGTVSTGAPPVAAVIQQQVLESATPGASTSLAGINPVLSVSGLHSQSIPAPGTLGLLGDTTSTRDEDRDFVSDAFMGGKIPAMLSDLLPTYETLKSRTSLDSAQQQATPLEQSMQNLPDAAESERLRYYTPKLPQSTPPYYPQNPVPVLDNPQLFERLDIDTLFFIFYFQQGTYQQYLAARELKKQSWRFHKKFFIWFQRHEEPKAITDDYEQGTYIYFDWETSWCQRKKTDFTFNYQFLEDENYV